VTDQKRSVKLDWAISAVQGQLAPVPLTSSELRQFVGTYGPATVTLIDDHLEFHSRGATYRMIPIGEDTFLLQGIYHQRLRFLRNEAGDVTSVVSLSEEGPVTADCRER
jgi:hypothetical protein